MFLALSMLNLQYNNFYNSAAYKVCSPDPAFAGDEDSILVSLFFLFLSWLQTWSGRKDTG